MTPEEEVLIAALEHIERRTDDLHELLQAAEARRRALARSVAGPGRALTLTKDQLREIAEADADLGRAEAALIEIGSLRRQFSADLERIASGGQDVGG